MSTYVSTCTKIREVYFLSFPPIRVPASFFKSRLDGKIEFHLAIEYWRLFASSMVTLCRFFLFDSTISANSY